MTLIRICEREGEPNAALTFDGGDEYRIAVRDPFDEEEEARLEWYFEQHPRFPFTDGVKAQQAAASVTAYGEALFGQVFSDPDAYAHYKTALQAGVETLALEVAGSPAFHALHWEALKDPRLPQPLALQAPLVRRNLRPQTVRAEARPAPTINVLVVSARPGGARDVGYRTISRPLVEGLRQAGVPVQVDLVRPGSYRALVQCLEEAQDREGTGHYHVLHLDVHGALLTYERLQKGARAERYLYNARYGRADIAPYEGRKAFLFFEGEREGQSDPVESQELADLLLLHQVPVVVLNACQSGKQVGASETSLGRRLMDAGAQAALAMGYAVTVSAAERLMAALYRELWAGRDLAAAACRARLELHNDKRRRAYFDQAIDLEDWMLPVVYQNRAPNRAPALQVREFTPEERAAYYERRARRYRPPAVTYGFVGRDLDVLRVERRLLTGRNALLIRGMGGVGKTTLLHHLAAWWQSTGFVGQAFYFGYDERAWTRQQIVVEVARALLGEAAYAATFLPLGPEAQQALLAERLRAERHLLVLDNLESITGRHLAVRNTLPPAERQRLRGLLCELTGGRTLVLLGSRGGEEWLAAGTFEDNVYPLPGLDPEAASALAERVLERHGATRYREDPDLQHLLDLLDGYPLPMEVVLANLARQAPGEVLAALQGGEEGVDLRGGGRTESILRCVDYSHSNLSPEAQQLLLCLAPFTGVIFEGALEAYSERLRAQPALAHLPFERWAEVLGEARDWGLLAPHPQAQGFLRLQPVLPYFLRSRLASPSAGKVKAAVEAAFRQLYDQMGDEIAALLTSKEAGERQLGQAVAGLEYENLVTAVNLALEAQESVSGPYQALDEYWDATQDHRRALELCSGILSRLRAYPVEKLHSRRIGFSLGRLLGDMARRQLGLNEHQAAEQSYLQSLEVFSDIEDVDEEQRGKWTATAYHELGRVAQEQRQWTQAEGYYRQALEIYIAFNDRYAQAKTYHQLGRVAQEQRQWAQAEGYLGQALEIYVEFDDRYHQASTYHQLGRVAEEQRQWAQAEGYYRQALEIKIEFDDRYGQASTYHQLGRVAEEGRQWAQAEGYYRQALEIYIAFDDRYAQAVTYHQLGMVAQEQRQWAQAERYYRQALEIKIEFGDRYEQAGTYGQLGLLAEEQQQTKQAQDYLLQALKIFHDAGDEHYTTVTLRNLARVWREGGDADLPAAVAAVLEISPQEAEDRLRAAAPGEEPDAG